MPGLDRWTSARQRVRSPLPIAFPLVRTESQTIPWVPAPHAYRCEVVAASWGSAVYDCATEVFLSALATPLDLGALLFVDVDAVLARLPADARARLAWAREPIFRVRDRLRNDELSDELVAEAGDVFLRGIIALAPHGISIAGGLDEQRAAVMSDLLDEETRLRGFLHDDASRETMEWVASLLRSYVVRSYDELRALPRGALDAINWEIELRGNAISPVLRHLARGVIALMAAADAARDEKDPERAGDLVDVAFLELIAFRDEARAGGFWFDAFSLETTAERRARAARDVAGVRRSLGADDWATVDQAKLRNLR